MININLLPPDSGPKAPVLKAVALLKRLTIGALVIFCVFCVLTIGYIYFLNIQVKKSNASQETLKNSIKSFEETEQKLFLVKDRLAKIKNVLAVETTEKEFENIDQILASGEAGVSVSEMDILPGKIDLEANADASETLSEFLDKILVNPLYKTVKLTTFSYNPESGYSFGLGVLTK